MGRARADHRGDAGVGARGGALDDRVRDVGDRVQVRGGHRARARSRRDPGRAAGRQRAAVRDGPGGRGQAAGRARRAVRADLADGGLLQRHRGRGHGRRRRPAALLRRRLPGQQGARRAAVLARAGDGGRVPGPGALRRRRGRGRRQHHHARARRGIGAAGGRGRGERDALRRGRDHAVPRRDRAQRQQGRLALRRAPGVDERRAVPDAARPGRAHRRPARRRGRVRDRHRRARAGAGARGDAPSGSWPPPRRAPAT